MTDRVSRSRQEHADLSLGLIESVRNLYASAMEDTWPATRDAVVQFYQSRLAPHIEAEERLVLKVAEDQRHTALLAQALRAQHRALDARSQELRDATTGLDAVAAARAIHALFALHVIQLDDFLLPALKTQTPPSRREPAARSGRHTHS